MKLKKFLFASHARCTIESQVLCVCISTQARDGLFGLFATLALHQQICRLLKVCVRLVSLKIIETFRRFSFRVLSSALSLCANNGWKFRQGDGWKMSVIWMPSFVEHKLTYKSKSIGEDRHILHLFCNSNDFGFAVQRSVTKCTTEKVADENSSIWICTSDSSAVSSKSVWLP